MFAGTFTALITPFRDGHLDRDAFQALIERQIAAGITGVVPVGTTGESPTLDSEEHLAVVKAAVELLMAKSKFLPVAEQTPPAKRSTSPRPPKRWGQTPLYRFAHTTISPARKVSTSTTRR